MIRFHLISHFLTFLSLFFIVLDFFTFIVTQSKWRIEKVKFHRLCYFTNAGLLGIAMNELQAKSIRRQI